MTTKTAAHFLLIPELAYSPPNDAIVSALLGLGYKVDLFAPGGSFSVDQYGPNVGCGNVEYNNEWILKNLFSPRWRKYDLFSGTAEDPMAVVGALAFWNRRPSFTLADEIKSGSYYGNRPESWKKLCRWGMRRSRFTIVNDESRIQLQREYAGASLDHKIIVYPGCFRECPPPGDRIALRNSWRIPQDALTIAFSGGLSKYSGFPWMMKALDIKPEAYLLLQAVNTDPLLEQARSRDRIYIEPRRLGWRESWASMAAVDIGVAVYHHDGPQFQNMGISSNRICMFLSMGVPVIVSRQPSFEFLEKYDCGVLVGNEEEFIKAVGYIQSRLPQMKENAKKCAREYIDAEGKYRQLVESLIEVV
jgi:glycosyltransferase involved in cell wall biosynthesis